MKAVLTFNEILDYLKFTNKPRTSIFSPLQTLTNNDGQAIARFVEHNG